MFPHIVYGGDYNPEQWDETVWQEDARLMEEAGVNLVTLGVFGWSKIETADGEYDFSWLDRIFDLLYSHGVQVDLATPTASPPPWLVRLHPEILPVTADGLTLWHGSRRHYCPHSTAYRAQAQQLVRKMAQHFGSHPALALWHIDNEYSCHIGECFCDESIEAFRRWLRERYGTLENLNRAWCTAFWSQSYGEWEEIAGPRRTPAQINPAEKVDWQRFCSDSWLACFEDQKTILREETPKIAVTTNFMAFHKGLEHWKWAEHEDVVSLDSYPDTSDPLWMVQAGMACDLMRSLGRGRPWLMMEQAAAQVNWRQRNVTKRPGVMRLGSYQALARGADGILFFQWRASAAGFEQFHSGMLPHSGTDSRTWREVKSLGKELTGLIKILGSRVRADVAILLDWENWWALEGEGKPSNDILMIPQLSAYYAALYKRHITVDFAHPGADLSAYKLVIAPNLFLVSESSVNNLIQYVRNGGILLMSFFSGIVDENQRVRLGGYPAPFQEMLGLRVEEFAPYAKTQKNWVLTRDGQRFECTLWSDVIQLKGGEVLANYQNDYYAGCPAITNHRFGRGSAYYLGTELEADGLDWLVKRINEQAGIQMVMDDIPAGVEIVRRINGKQVFIFILNHNSQEAVVTFEQGGMNLLSGEMVGKQIRMEGMGVAVIEIEGYTG